jgi:Flp pilus assembly pilin Flp
MKKLWKRLLGVTRRRRAQPEAGVTALEFTLIMVLVAVAILASLDSASATLEQFMLQLSSGLLP